jgi:hypothetical protein
MMKCTRHYDYIFAALMAPFTGKDEVKTLPKAGKPGWMKSWGHRIGGMNTPLVGKTLCCVALLSGCQMEAH